MCVLINRASGQVLSENARIASGGWASFIGLMGRIVTPGEALGLPHCAAVHTFFVRQPLDIVFCDREGRVLRVVAARKPFQVGPSVRGAAMAWEARAGTLAPWVAPGDLLEYMSA